MYSRYWRGRAEPNVRAIGMFEVESCKVDTQRRIETVEVQMRLPRSYRSRGGYGGIVVCYLSSSEPATHEKVRNCSTRSSSASLEE